MAKVRPKKTRVGRARKRKRETVSPRPTREPDQILYTFKEGSAWVAGFVPFDLVSQGSTEAEARQRLDSAIAATILWDIEDGVEPLSRVKQTPKHVVAEWARKYRETRTLSAPIDATLTARLLVTLDALPDENLATAVARVVGERDRLVGERDGLAAERDRLHTKCSDLVKQQDDFDNKLRGIIDASQFEQVDAAATRLAEELQSWRSGCAAAFGGYTANPHKTLVEIAKSQREHHEKHHELEKLLVSAAKNVLTDNPGYEEAVALRKQVDAVQAQLDSEVV